jgi:hypothetical protein
LPRGDFEEEKVKYHIHLATLKFKSKKKAIRNSEKYMGML